MPSRVGFKKSRNGCVRCKSRKVKCDEQLPSCGWCREHSFHCQYTVPKQSGKGSVTTTTTTVEERSPQTIVSSEYSTGSTCPLLDEASPQRRLLELGLLQYYVMHVARTHPYVDKEYGYRLHADLIPQQALRFPVLLNTMNAYTLLHIHVESSTRGVALQNADFFEGLGLRIPGSRPGSFIDGRDSDTHSIDALTLHRHYLDRALQEQRMAVSDITPENADSTICTSILIGMTALIYATQQASTVGPQPYSVPLQWFYLCRSFTTCLDVARSWLTPESATMKMINTAPCIRGSEILSTELLRFRYLLHWQSQSDVETVDEEGQDAYQKAIACIESVYNHIASEERWEALGRKILAFPNIVPKMYVNFLEEKRPRAVVILAHLLAMSKKLDQLNWIFRGVADYHVRGLAQLVPEEWQWTLAWPLQVLQQEGYPFPD